MGKRKGGAETHLRPPKSAGDADEQTGEGGTPAARFPGPCSLTIAEVAILARYRLRRRAYRNDIPATSVMVQAIRNIHRFALLIHPTMSSRSQPAGCERRRERQQKQAFRQQLWRIQHEGARRRAPSDTTDLILY
jgi:hypothetical protein